MSEPVADSAPPAADPGEGWGALFEMPPAGPVEVSRPAGYRVLTANSGEEALAILEAEPADPIISDMRMPGMSGAQVLAAVRARWPDTVRILLAGYADIGSTIDAINSGQLHRYISKPWGDAELVFATENALMERRLERECSGITRVKWGSDGSVLLDGLDWEEVRH